MTIGLVLFLGFLAGWLCCVVSFAALSGVRHSIAKPLREPDRSVN